jgi:hypothetical protein
MREARLHFLSLLFLCGVGAFWTVAAYGPLGAGKPRPLELLPADAPDPSRPDAEPRVVYDLATLPPAEAARLQGRRELYRVRLDSAPAEVGGRLVYEVAVREPDALGTVWLPRGQLVEDVMTVEAELKVLNQRTAVGARGAVFPGFTEYRLLDAVRAGR